MSTIKDVAQLAGVSVSTVSRALSNRVFVEESTKQRVLAAVKELNYQPSVMAKALREGRSYVLALLVPDINSLFYPELMKNVEKAAAEKGYALFLCNNNESIEKERQTVNMLASRGIDGLLCMSVRDDISHLLEFRQKTGIPVVLVNRNFPEQISCVTGTDELGGYMMTKYLLEQGHRRIAGVFGNFDMQRFRARYDGCKRALEEYGVKDYKRYFIYDASTIEEAYLRTKDMLALPNKPTAFFATMDILTIGVYRGIEESGLRVPDDISVVGYDNIFMAQYMNPPLTTYSVPIAELAKHAVDVVVGHIEGKKEKEYAVLEGTIAERKSVRRIDEA